MNQDKVLDVIDPLVTDIDITQEISLAQQLHDFVKVCEEYRVPNKEMAIALLGRLTASDKVSKLLRAKVYDYFAKRCPDCEKALFGGIEANQVTTYEYVYVTPEVLALQEQMANLSIKLDEAKKKAKAEAEAVEAQISLERGKLKPDNKVMAFLKDSLVKIREKTVKSVYWKAKF